MFRNFLLTILLACLAMPVISSARAETRNVRDYFNSLRGGQQAPPKAEPVRESSRVSESDSIWGPTAEFWALLMESARRDPSVHAALHTLRQEERRSALESLPEMPSLDMEMEKPGSQGEYSLRYSFENLSSGLKGTLLRSSGFRLRGLGAQVQRIFREAMARRMHASVDARAAMDRLGALQAQAALSARSSSSAQEKFNAGAITELQLRRFRMAETVAIADRTAAEVEAQASLEALGMILSAGGLKQEMVSLESGFNMWNLEGLQGNQPSSTSDSSDSASRDSRVLQARFARDEAREKLKGSRETLGGRTGFSAGVKYTAQDRDTSFIMGISRPLGSGFRLQRGRSEAGEAFRLAQALVADAELSSNLEQLKAVSGFRAAMTRVEALTGKAIPQARSIVEDLHAAYQMGNADYMELLDAEAGLQELNLSRIESLAQANHCLVDLMCLFGELNTGKGVLSLQLENQDELSAVESSDQNCRTAGSDKDSLKGEKDNE